MGFYLQFGYGMMGHTDELLSKWEGQGGVILSPRDLAPEQLPKVAKGASANGGEVLVDPQCYVRRADHQRLTQHGYWEVMVRNDTGGLLDPDVSARLLRELRDLNIKLGTSRPIIPALLAEPVDENWFELHSMLAERGSEILGQDALMTVPVGISAMQDEVAIETLVERVGGWNISSVYLIPQSPGEYLVEDPNWMSNLLILASGLKLAGKEVLVGYQNQQGLFLSTANVDSIASGTWLNVRSFSPDKFFAPDPDEVSRRAKGGWYYCPSSLSEYKMPFLDVADRQGLLEVLRPNESLPRSYSDALFSGAQPSTIAWGEKFAFRHYLDVLRSQWVQMGAASFDEALSSVRTVLDDAEHLCSELHANGVYGQDRDFGSCVDIVRSSLTLHERARGSRLRRFWK